MKKTLVAAMIATLAATSFGQINVAGSANGGFATQSSIWGSAGPERGNDGNRNGNWGANSVQHTDNEQGAFYNVAFDDDYTIDRVIVWNRTDSYSTRINPFNVSLLLGGVEVWSANNQTFAENMTSNPNGSGMSFAMSPVMADTVRVQLVNSNYLHMAELEAFTAVPEPATMIALAAGLLALARRRRN